jgi:Domain of unknown function (DUF1929)
MRSIRLAGVLCLMLFAPLVRAGEDVTPGCRLPPGTPTNPPPELIGAWDTVIPAEGSTAYGAILGMQTVHNAILPSGKVLMISGSSWRNLGPIEYYPRFPNPATPRGVFQDYNDPFHNMKIDTYFQLVNNAAVYDPVANTFYRIQHPWPVPDPKHPNHFAPNDLFCTGQQHLPDGSVLFVGGTQYYYPFRSGNNSTWVFNWRKEAVIPWQNVDWRQPLAPPSDPWTFAGFMQRGRWYATPVPLLDGRLAIFSGFVDLDPARPDSMYQFEINSLVEFFNPAAFSKTNPQAAWRSVDVKRTPGSPFTVLINEHFKPTPNTPTCTAGTPLGDRCINDFKHDAFKIYPENYLMADGRIYLTREGDWVSLRTCDTAFMRRTKNTYFATVGGTADAPALSFERGPDRPEDVSSYGTTFMNPDTGQIHLLGGQPTSPGTLYPINSTAPTHFAGGRGSRKIETFTPSATKPGGSWTLTPNFLGDEEQDDRTMHYAVMLPTKQVLVVNGGNFDFFGPVFYPLLLTPQYRNGKFTQYKTQRVADALEPRHYHNSAMLLPDARVFVSGGNTARATVYAGGPAAPKEAGRTGQPLPDLNLVDLDVYFFNDGPIGKHIKGMETSPTENWTAETYKPPYFYIDPGRQPSFVELLSDPVPYTFRSMIAGKPYYLFKSNSSYSARLRDLPTKPCTQKASLALIKLPSATHGWENGQKFVELQLIEGQPGSIEIRTPDAKKANIPPAFYMLFYVDCRGVPSISQMVRFDDSAKEP